MKIRCDTEVLRKAVQVVRNVVPAKLSLALGSTILNDIKIEATQDFLVLSATNLEVSIQYQINDVVIDEPGVMVCPESKLAPILKEWKCETIGIDESKRVCSIKGKDASFIIMCADPKEFPKMPKFKDKDCIEIDKDILADMLRKTAFIGCDVFLKVGAYGNTPVQEAVMVSNDGRRLAEATRSVVTQNLEPVQCVIPKKTIPQISSAIKDHEGAVKVKIEKKRIFVQAGNVTLCSQLMEVQYPEYEDVIPKGLDKEISAEREAFFSAVRRGAVMTNGEYKLLCFTFEAGKMSLLCVSPDVGEAHVEVPVEYEGDKVVIGLNPDYIIDLSKVIDTENVTMRLKDSNTACVFETPTYRYVIMPMELEK